MISPKDKETAGIQTLLEKLKGVEIWKVYFVKYTGPFLNWTREDRRNMYKKTKLIIIIIIIIIIRRLSGGAANQ